MFKKLKKSFCFELILILQKNMDKDRFALDDIHYIYDGILAKISDKNYKYEITIKAIER